MAIARRNTAIRFSLVALFIAFSLLLLLCVSSPIWAQHTEDDTPVQHQQQQQQQPPESAEDTKDATSSVHLLSADNFDQSIASGDMWFVKFFAPWCQHCKMMAPEWEKAAQQLTHEQQAFHFAEVDCTVSEDLCTRYNVPGFPTLKLLQGDLVIDYDGPREAPAFVKFAHRMMRPPLTPISEESQLSEFLASHPTGFVFFGEQDSAEKTQLEIAVQQFRASFDFAHAAPSLLAKGTTEMGVSPSPSSSSSSVTLSPPTLVSRTPDSTFVFDGAWDSNSLKSWISSHRFGLLPELSPQNFFEITKIGKPVVLMALLPTKQKQETTSFQEIGRQVARSFFDSFSFSWIDGEKWTQYIEGTYHVGQADMPHAIVLDPAKNGYYNLKLVNQETFSTFLDSIISGILKPTIFKQSDDQQSQQELTQFQNYKMLLEEYIIEYLWYTLLGVFFGGLICGKFVFGGRKSKPSTSKSSSSSSSSKQSNGKAATPTKKDKKQD